MKKSLVPLLAVSLVVLSTSGSAFAGTMMGGYNSSYQRGQVQYKPNSYTGQYYNQGIYNNTNHNITTFKTNSSNQNKQGLNQNNLIQAMPAQQAFRDLSQNYWAYGTINKMRDLGVVNGDTNGNFNPENQVTRAEFATMLVNALKLSANQGTTQTFTDVPSTNWAFQSVEAAQNYLTGYRDASGQLNFSPQSPAVREDIIVAAVKALSLENEAPDLSVLSKFADTNQISPNLEGYVAIAVKHGLVGGSQNTSGQYQLNPQGKLTRAEAAVFLYRVLQNNGTELDQQPVDQEYTKVILGQGQQTVNEQGPALTSANYSDSTVTLNFNESLNTNSVPGRSNFAVYVNGTLQPEPASVTISGSSIKLWMDQSIPYGDTVTVSYTPGTYPVQDLNGYDTSSFANYQASYNETSNTNAPVWPQNSSLSVYNLSTDGLTLSWPQVTDNSDVNYRIYQDGNLLCVVSGSIHSYNVTGLSPDTNYNFRVDAIDTAGNITVGPSLNTTTIE